MSLKNIYLQMGVGVTYILMCVCVGVAALCLGELVVNPHQQLIEPFNWVMDWEGMLSLSSMVGLLDKHFFNKWLQVGLGILFLKMQSFISNLLYLHYAEKHFPL